MVLPAMQEVYKELNLQYTQISAAIENGTNQDKIEALKKSYKAKSDEELLMALKPHPISVTLAQAAMESSWGTSRFFKEANNLFGVWSFNKNEPRIAANGQRGDKTIWLKKYASIKESVADYYKNMGRSFAFKEFRQEKMLSNNPYILVTKLDRYSEKGAQYGVELTSMMSFNKFLKYDDVFFERPPKVETVQADIKEEEKVVLNTQENKHDEVKIAADVKSEVQNQSTQSEETTSINPEVLQTEINLDETTKITVSDEIPQPALNKETKNGSKDIETQTTEITKEKES